MTASAWACSSEHGGERDVLARLGLDRELPDILLREEALGDLAEHPDRRRDGAEEDQEDQRPCPEAQVEQDRVAGGRRDRRFARTDCAAVCRHDLAAAGRRAVSIGARVSETKAEAAMAMVTVTANSWNTRPTTPPMSRTGMNTATSDTVIDRMVKPISPLPFSAASNGRHALLDVADDVLEHDDGVVDHQAHRQGQRQQRDVVDRIAEQIHGAESRDDRDRHRHARDRGRAQAAQEQVDHQDHQPHGDQQRDLDVVDRGADRCRAVVEHVDAARGAQLRVELRQHGLDPVDHRHGVGAGLALDGQHQRALAVEAARLLRVLDRIDHPREVAQADRVIVAGRHDQVAEGGRVGELGARLDGQVLRLALDRADGRVDVRRRHRVLDLVDADAARGQGVGVELDPHGVALAAEDLDLADAVDGRQGGRDHLLREGVERRQRRGGAGQRQQQDRRVGRVELAVAGRRGHLDRQLPLRPGDRGLHVGRRLVDVAVEVELDHDRGRALRSWSC